MPYHSLHVTHRTTQFRHTPTTTHHPPGCRGRGHTLPMRRGPPLQPPPPPIRLCQGWRHRIPGSSPRRPYVVGNPFSPPTGRRLSRCSRPRPISSSAADAVPISIAHRDGDYPSTLSESIATTPREPTVARRGRGAGSARARPIAWAVVAAVSRAPPAPTSGGGAAVMAVVVCVVVAVAATGAQTAYVLELL